MTPAPASPAVATSTGRGPDGPPIAAARDLRGIRDAIDAHITELLTQLAA
ncbi:hypothetical protein [Streptomyces sp. DSM 40907]|nr:hypothetical protein [Streptomyces sp. DSM 40907]